MSIADLIEAMTAAGAPASAIVIAVRAIEEARSEIESRRASERERKQRQRAMSRDSHGTVTGHVRDNSGPPLPPDKGPPDPLKLTPNPLPFSDPKGSSFPKSFEEFWLAYPRKVGKGAARPAYGRALSKLNGDGAALILSGLESAKRDWKDPQFIPHPATWLNQERWADETEPIDRFERARHEPLQLPGDRAERIAKLRRELGTDGPDNAETEAAPDSPAGLLGGDGAGDLGSLCG